jgi:acyl carrier protein
MTAKTRIASDMVRELLADRHIFPDLPEDVADDTQFAMDSMGTVWFLHQLQVRHGLTVDPSDAELDKFTSIGAIVNYLNRE